MGVYIDMEMPKKGSWIGLRVFPDGHCVLHSWCGNDDEIKFEFMEHLTAVSVPEPHGRLGDLDDFAKRMKSLVEKAENDGFDLGAVWYSTFVQHIELTSTIIPADPPKE